MAGDRDEALAQTIGDVISGGRGHEGRRVLNQLAGGESAEDAVSYRLYPVLQRTPSAVFESLALLARFAALVPQAVTLLPNSNTSTVSSTNMTTTNMRTTDMKSTNMTTTNTSNRCATSAAAVLGVFQTRVLALLHASSRGVLEGMLLGGYTSALRAIAQHMQSLRLLVLDEKVIPFSTSLSFTSFSSSSSSPARKEIPSLNSNTKKALSTCEASLNGIRACDVVIWICTAVANAVDDAIAQ